MRVLTLDFETYYDTAQDYTLRRMSTEDYVSDPRFEFIGCAAHIDNMDAGYIASDSVDKIGGWLTRFDIPKMALAGHHLMFDGLLLAEKFGLYPAFYACTESMCRPFLKPLLRSLSLGSVAEYLGFGRKGTEVVRADGKRLRDFSPQERSEYMAYCENDVRLTRDIYNWARPQLTSTEMRLIDLTLRMYLQPQLVLDAGEYGRGLRDVRERQAKIMAEQEAQGVTAKMLRSNQQFAKVLRDRGIEPPMKVSPTWLKKPPAEQDPEKKMAYAFSKSDPEFIDLREEFADDLEITTLLNARINIKGSIEERRNETLLGLAQKYGKYRAALSYYSAHTGRYAGTRERAQD